MPNKYKMFLISYFCWLCLVSSLLAYPLNQYKDSDFQSGLWSGQADYPDLTRGLTDAEVRDTLKDLTLDDLKSLDHLINEHITQREEANKASLRAQSKKNFRAVGSKSDDGCREENECEEPKQVSRCKPQTCPTTTTTKRCMKTTTCAPKTTRTTCKPECVPKTTCSSNDIFAKCPKVNNRRKKSKEDNEWVSDDFHGQARKRMEKELHGDAPAKYTPARDLAGIEKIGEDQGEPLDETYHLDYPKESRLMESAQLHDNHLANRKPESLANLDQGHHASFEEHHQSHFEQANHKLQHETNLNHDHHESNFGREQEVNLKQNPKANVQQEHFDNFKQDLWASADPANWDDMEQTESDRMKLSNWASLNPANLANIEDASFDLTNYVNEEDQGHGPQFVQEQSHFELGKDANFQPAREQQATFQMGNHNHDYKQDNQAKLEQGNQATSEHENRANIQLQNQDSFDQTHPNRQVRDYQQANLNRAQTQHQDSGGLRSEVNVHPSGHQYSRKRNAEQENQALMPRREQRSDANYHPRQWSSNQPLTNQEKLNKVDSGEPAPLGRYEGNQLSRKRNAEQKSQASMPQGGTYRQQRSEVKYHPRTEQWSSNQPLTNQAKLNKMEGEQLDPYQGHQQLYQKRNAKIEKTLEKRRVSVEEKEHEVAKNNEAQPVNADLTQQSVSHFDVDSFLANNARNPPRYLNSMQNDRIQRENERRLTKDRSLSESLNLDKLTGEKEASSAGESDWEADNKRGKRENRSTDDAPENSRETYLKKLMDSFPRDQGSQIDANVALNECPFAHERMKRS